jgi:hypothetical protein
MRPKRRGCRLFMKFRDRDEITEEGGVHSRAAWRRALPGRAGKPEPICACGMSAFWPYHGVSAHGRVQPAVSGSCRHSRRGCQVPAAPSRPAVGRPRPIPLKNSIAP